VNYSEFFNYLKRWRTAKRYPPASAWPKEINLDRFGWEGINKLYHLTKLDLHEYETSFFYLDGETLITTPLRGTYEQVTSNHSLEVKYEIDQKKRIYYRNVIIDGKVSSRSAIKPEKLLKHSQVGFLYNVHTHPKHINLGGQTTYSFFSDTDIRSLLKSDALVAGLITDSFWLVVKTDSVISQIGEVGVGLLHEISEHAFAGEAYLDDLIRKNMSRWGLVFYRGSFNSPLIRVN